METEFTYLLDKYGFEYLVLKHVEEHSEFMTALLHLPKTGDYEKVYDEFSDLLITIDRLLHALDCHNNVMEWKVKNLIELKQKVKDKVL